MKTKKDGRSILSFGQQEPANLVAKSLKIWAVNTERKAKFITTLLSEKQKNTLTDGL